MKFSLCPDCEGEFQRSSTLLVGVVVVRCPGCKTYHIDGDQGYVVTRGPNDTAEDVIALLRERALKLNPLTCPDDDERWERIS